HAELSFGRMISPLAELRQKMLQRMTAVVDGMTRRTREVDWVSGACLMIRRADLESAGLFDERFFMYTGTSTCAHRCARAGERCSFSRMRRLSTCADDRLRARGSRRHLPIAAARLPSTKSTIRIGFPRSRLTSR